MAFKARAHAILAVAIPAMRIVDAFSYDYGPANVARPSQWSLPQVTFTIESESDRPDKQLGKLEQDAILTIKAIAPAPVSPQTLQEVCDAIETDFKRLLQNLDSSLRSAGMMRATYQGGTWLPRFVSSAPAEITLTFSLWYRQSRSNPS